MAEQFDEFPPEVSRRELKYKKLHTGADGWLNGKAWRLTASDIEGNTFGSFLSTARQIAGKQGLGIKTGNTDGGKTLWIQAGPKQIRKQGAKPAGRPKGTAKKK